VHGLEITSGRDLDLLTLGQKDALLVLRTICKVRFISLDFLCGFFHAM
jgi:hypothetical protein